MNPFSVFPKEDIQVEKANGTLKGPYNATIAGGTIVVWDATADIEEEDTILRHLPNGKDERSEVTQASFYHDLHGMPAHFQIKFKKAGAKRTPQPVQPLSSEAHTSKKDGMPTYDIAISFAGEDRNVAERLASLLVLRGLKVFYDEYEQANLWGKDLYVHLSKVYKDEAKYCLMLVSEHYSKKQWTNHERKAAQARAFQENSEYILPLRLDDAQVDGILCTVGFLDQRKISDDMIVESVVKKVFDYNNAHGISYDLVKVEDVFAQQGIGKDGAAIKDSNMKTECPACGTVQLLSESNLSVDEGETIYTCKHGCQPILVVGRPAGTAWPGRGYRLGDHVIRNVRDVIVKTDDMRAALVINGGNAALMKRRPAE